MIISPAPVRTAVPARKIAAAYVLVPALLILAGGLLFLGADPEIPASAAAPMPSNIPVRAEAPPAPAPVITARVTTPLAESAAPVIPAHPGDDSAYMTPEEEQKLYGEAPAAGTP